MRWRKGYSLVMWTVTLSMVIMGVLFIRTPLKRALQGRIIGSADYLFWTRWGEEVDQYKGEEANFSKARDDENQNTTVAEFVLPLPQRSATYVETGVDSAKGEDSVSAAVEEGSEIFLRKSGILDNFDLTAPDALRQPHDPRDRLDRRDRPRRPRDRPIYAN